jgi:hypothetical protein
LGVFRPLFRFRRFPVQHPAMTTRNKTWRDKRDAEKQPKRVRLEADFAGVKAGQMLFVGTPRLIDDYLRSIPRGETRSIERLRRELARAHRCDATCPVSTAIFLRIAAEAAWEDLENGRPVEAVTPFWRAIEPDSTIARKLRADSRFIEQQRALEAPPAKPGAPRTREVSARRPARRAAGCPAPGAARRSRPQGP